MWQITEWKDKESWNAFLLSLQTQTGVFQQTWEWLMFQHSLGRRAVCLGITPEAPTQEPETLAGILGITRLPLPFHKYYWYSPRGPLMYDAATTEEFFNAFKELKKFLSRTVVAPSDIFWRHEPLANTAPLHRGISGYGGIQPLEATGLKTRGGQHMILHSIPTDPVQPEKTSIIDLRSSNEQLFGAMHEKTRYSIRLAIKKEVRVAIEAPTGRPMEQFITLLHDTAKRNGFRMHDPEYYRAMGRAFSHDATNHATFSVRLATAYHADTPIAVGLIGYFGDTVTYLHGASNHNARALMGPFLMHWEIMQASRRLGYRYYDLWGIDEKKYLGVTNFKTRFGGHTVLYPGTFDLPLSRFWYKLYRTARKLRRL